MEKNQPILKVANISKRYGRILAVDGVSLEIRSGDIYALVGPNGAGKTTLLKMLVGLEVPDSGRIEIGGLPMSPQAVSAKRKFGYVPDNPRGFDYITGREFLYYTGSLKGLGRSELKERIREALQIFPVADIADSYLGGYSRGNRQKFAVLSALLGEPELFIIDEPIVGLDPSSIVRLGKLITRSAASGKAVLFVTHILDFAEKYATRVGVMKAGKLTGEITPSAVIQLTDL